MRRRTRSRRAVVAAIVLTLLLVPLHAQAQKRGITQAEAQRGLEVGLDLIVLRPLGLGALVLGAGFFVPAVILGSPGGMDNINAAKDLLIDQQVERISRPLGDF